MTQQYQHISASEIQQRTNAYWDAYADYQDKRIACKRQMGLTFLKTSPRLLELLNKSVVKPAPAKHPLLMPPYVKE